MINIIIIEDSQDDYKYLADAIHRYAEQSGEVFSVKHYVSALLFLNEYKADADIIFMDIELPDINGVLAGQDLWDGSRSGMDTLAGLENDSAIVFACRLATKHIIYSVINSHAMNIGDAQIIPAMPWWEVAILSGMIAFIVLTVASAAMLTVSVIKSRKK